MNGDLVIETSGLTKRYGKRTVVDELTIAVPAGVVAGFVGPNGAGKTTTMSMLLGLVSASGGRARVLGEPLSDPARYLAQVGALIESPAFYQGLSGEENLRLLATVGQRDPAQVPELIALVGLEGRGADRFGSYSLGMKQRLGIAAALLGEPALLILDEPTNGLDPAGIHEMRQLLSELADGGRTVFVSSHVLTELEQICDWFVIIDHGTRVFQGTASELLDGAAASLVVAPEHDADLDRLRSLLDTKGLSVKAGQANVVVDVGSRNPRALAAEVNRAATGEGLVLTELHLQRMNLEERYLAMVNGGGDR